MPRARSQSSLPENACPDLAQLGMHRGRLLLMPRLLPSTSSPARRASTCRPKTPPAPKRGRERKPGGGECPRSLTGREDADLGRWDSGGKGMVPGDNGRELSFVVDNLAPRAIAVLRDAAVGRGDRADSSTAASGPGVVSHGGLLSYRIVILLLALTAALPAESGGSGERTANREGGRHHRILPARERMRGYAEAGITTCVGTFPHD
jgi:hypothetical protein